MTIIYFYFSLIENQYFRFNLNHRVISHVEGGKKHPAKGKRVFLQKFRKTGGCKNFFFRKAPQGCKNFFFGNFVKGVGV